MIPSKLTQSAANKAVTMAATALQNDEVRQQLRDAPEAIARWAKAQRKSLDERHLDPFARFGQAGLERRLTALETNVELAFDDETNASRITILRAVLELQKALVVSATMPLMSRKKVQMRIDSEIAELEQLVVDAVLPAR